MRRVRSLQFVVLLIIAGLIGYYFGVNNVNISWKNYKPSLSIISKEAPAEQSLVDFSTFWNVWQRLEASYYDKVKLDPTKMLNGAIEGMVQSLGDPYTMYLAPTQNTNFKDGMAGQFSGIGAELGMKDKQIIVIAPLEGSPAEKAGIKAGDAILKVNEDSTADWALPLAVEKIRGPKGTTVVLTILHKDQDKPSDITIVRDTITVKSVTGWVKPIREIEGINPSAGHSTVSSDRIGSGQAGIKGKENEKAAYIRLSQFGDSTKNDWATVVNEIFLKMQSEKDIKGLIIDLRNNPGGYLDDAVFIASEFLPVGTKVVSEDPCTKPKEQDCILNVRKQGLLTDPKIKVSVLINKGSASASEIVSGALRDNKRATLVGETSFGKGTIQQANDLGNGAGIHITIAKWLTPDGVWVNGEGLVPDIEVKLDEKDLSHDLQLEKAVLELVK